ncbi:MAG: beta-ketoacyl-[Desulfovibrio sp.]|nr:beta-ketoacyl-[acyl-carrier-protein] synthase family protein [Desulfovibrio sp.]
MNIAVTGMSCLCAAGSSPSSALYGLASVRNRFHGTLPDARMLPYPFFMLPDSCFGGRRQDSALDTMALASSVAKEALKQAGMGKMGDAAVVFGTTAGSALHFFTTYAAHKKGESIPSPNDRDAYFVSNIALNLDVETSGPRLTVTDACTSGADALGIACDFLCSGQGEWALCGGADAIGFVPHTGFARLGIVSKEACKPFDRNRLGLNLGEGAAALVLERFEHAKKRHAPILGLITGFGQASDAYHITAPHPDGRGLRKAVSMALSQSGISAKDVAFVNAHGTATRENDRVEGRTLLALLPGVPVWASKGGTGHTLGAAGALEAVLTLTALQHGFLPKTLGFSEVDPEIGLEPTTRDTVITKEYAISTSLGFGGGNAALVFKRTPYV